MKLRHYVVHAGWQPWRLLVLSPRRRPSLIRFTRIPVKRSGCRLVPAGYARTRRMGRSRRTGQSGAKGRMGRTGLGHQGRMARARGAPIPGRSWPIPVRRNSTSRMP
jgi:hypothetical protein